MTTIFLASEATLTEQIGVVQNRRRECALWPTERTNHISVEKS